MKIVVNKCYGGFGLSVEALELLGLDDDDDVERTNPKLIKLVEKMGNECNGGFSKLVVVEIPDECTDWEIDDYDGYETIVYVINGKLAHDE